MIRSMTGYGKGEAASNGRTFTVEIRSVNHRFCEISLRLPRRYSQMDADLRKEIAGRVARGKLDATLSVTGTGSPLAFPKADIELARSYYEVLASIRKELGISSDITVKDITSLPDVLTIKEDATNIEEDRSAIEEALTKGLDDLNGMRSAEGDALAREILSRLDRIARVASEVERFAPKVLQLYKKRLEERIKGLGIGIDEGRLAQEVVLYADRSDITEELVRLKSHLDQFRLISAAGDSSGKKLDFLIQEINREINTIGSKGNDAGIAMSVVEMKAELEKIREQLQNIE